MCVHVTHTLTHLKLLGFLSSSSHHTLKSLLIFFPLHLIYLIFYFPLPPPPSPPWSQSFRDPWLMGSVTKLYVRD